MPQLNLLGEGPNNEFINEQIDFHLEWITECQKVLNSDWNEYEKGQWWMSYGGEIEKASINEEIKEQINYLNAEVKRMRKQIIEKEW